MLNWLLWLIPFKQPVVFKAAMADSPILALIFKSFIDMNFPSFLASTKHSAATVPKPGILLNGGLIQVQNTYLAPF